MTSGRNVMVSSLVGDKTQSIKAVRNSYKVRVGALVLFLSFLNPGE